METTELPVSARLARKALKMIAVPLIVLAVAVRFTIPAATWWVDYAFLALLVVAAVLAAIGRVTWRKTTSPHEENRPRS